MTDAIRLGDIVRLKGSTEEGRVVAIDGDKITVVYPVFDEDGVPVGAGPKVTHHRRKWEKPRVEKGDLAYSRKYDVEGKVTYVRGQYATLRPTGGGLPIHTTTDDLLRLNHYSDEEMDV